MTTFSEVYGGYRISWHHDWYTVSLSIHGNERTVYQSNDLNSCYAWIDAQRYESMRCAILSYGSY